MSIRNRQHENPVMSAPKAAFYTVASWFHTTTSYVIRFGLMVVVFMLPFVLVSSTSYSNGTVGAIGAIGIVGYTTLFLITVWVSFSSSVMSNLRVFRKGVYGDYRHDRSGIFHEPYFEKTLSGRR